jgi:DHA2 family multidrug resistance protein
MLALLYPTLERQTMNLGLLRHGDWWGIGFMTVGLACLQTALDEGNKDDWFGSPLIVRLLIVAAVSLAIFVVIELRSSNPAVQLRLLGHRNFAFGTIANIAVGIALFGSVYVLPAYLQEVQGYNAEQVGLVLAWVGIPQLFIIPFVPLLQKHFDARAIVCAGLVVFAVSCLMNTHLSADSGADQFMSANIVRAFGQAVVLAPLAGIAVIGIPREMSGAAAGVFNMMRNLGGAIGTAMLATLITKREQFHSNIIGQSVTAYDADVTRFLDEAERKFLRHATSDPVIAREKAHALLGQMIEQQSLIMAFSDTFLVLAGVLLAAVVAVTLTRGRASADATA